ncbi:hypothetical protein FO519_009457, partial [Halicephalobus sp. NKZ332]
MAAEPSTRPVEEDYVKKLNLARTKDIPIPEDREKRIKPRRFHKKFKVRCPWVNCFATPLTWHCAHCGNELEVFEEENEVYFSCHCGDRKMTDFYGRCSHEHHPEIAIPFTENLKESINFEDNQREQRTIILLGDSGVGKSTSINNLITTVNYETWEEAKKGECINAVPLWRSIKINGGPARKWKQMEGCYMKNEKGTPRKSATANPVTYSFTYNDNGKEYLIMVVDTAGSNDTKGSKTVDENHRLDVVEQAISLESCNTFCFVIGSGGQRTRDDTTHVIEAMKQTLNPEFNKHTSFLQTNSSSLNIEETEVVVADLSAELEITFEIENNIYPINNEPYLAILDSALYKKQNEYKEYGNQTDSYKEYGDQTGSYNRSMDSFKEILKKTIKNNEFYMTKDDLQIARIRMYGHRDMETAFNRALELAGIRKQNLESIVDEEERKWVECEEKITEQVKKALRKEEPQNSQTKIELGVEAQENTDVEEIKNSEEVKNAGDSNDTKKTKNTKGNKEENTKVYEELENLLKNTELINETYITDNREESLKVTNSPGIKTIIKEIINLSKEFNDEKYYYIGVLMAVLGSVGIGAGATMYLIPHVIPFIVYGGAGISGSIVAITGMLTVIREHLRYKKARREQAKGCIKVIAMINEYYESLKCDKKFDYLSKLRQETKKNPRNFLVAFFKKQ